MATSAPAFTAEVERAVAAAAAYYSGADPLMSDDEYDTLLAGIALAVEASPELNEVEGVAGLLTEVAAGTISGGGVAHTTPMLSMSKSTDLDAIEKFAASVRAEFVIEPKVDGIAAVARYVDGNLVLVATRGDGGAGEDITDKVAALHVTGLPKTVRDSGAFEVRGEIYMSPSDFEFSNAARVASGGEPFANPRNATSGTVMRETVRYEARVSFAAYEAVCDDEYAPDGLRSDKYWERMDAAAHIGFRPARGLFPTLLDDTSVSEAIAAMGAARDAGLIPAPLDGAVVKVVSSAARERIGASSRHPRWAMAYKFPAVKVQTTLLDIERAVGRTGNISYTAVLAPVLVDGSTVERATLHNGDFIAERDMRIGDTVVLFKAGDIIPRVEEVVTAARPAGLASYVAPTSCPECGEELNRTGAIWRCASPTCSISAAVAYLASRDCLDVDGFSTAIADSLVERGLVKRLSDLFYLDAAALAALPMGETVKGNERLLGATVANKILAGLEATKSQPLNRVVCALGIKMTGRGMSRRLAAAFGSMDALVAADEAAFLDKGIDAVGPLRAKAFVAGFAAMAGDIARMAAAGVNMTGETPDAEDAVKPLAGLKVVVTGSVPGLSRTEAAEAVERLGGISSGSVSKSTDLVVIGEGAGSKEAKARELGVKIMDAEEFAVLAGGAA